MTAWDDFSRYCRLLSVDAQEEFHNAIDVLRQRHLLRLIPNNRLRDAQVTPYMAAVLGRAPDAEELAVARVTANRVPWPPNLRQDLARRQSFRCPVCGAPLARQLLDSHIDHIRALSLGGTNAANNLRLLCPACNLGKADLFDWRLGIPWHAAPRVGARLRYCVLMRAGNRCEWGACPVTASVGALVVAPRVPVSRGGRLIFDNLAARCEAHALPVPSRLHPRAPIIVPGGPRKIAVKPLRAS